MAKSKEDITYATAQAKVSADEALRVGYFHGTPLEAGKIADSEPVDLYSAAHRVSRTVKGSAESAGGQPQQHRDPATADGGGKDSGAAK